MPKRTTKPEAPKTIDTTLEEPAVVAPLDGAKEDSAPPLSNEERITALEALVASLISDHDVTKGHVHRLGSQPGIKLF